MANNSHLEQAGSPLIGPEDFPLAEAESDTKKGRCATSNQFRDSSLAILRARASRRGTKLKNTKPLVQESGDQELEKNIQNREGRRIQLDLEGASNRFSLLYNLAPVGYLTLDTTGRILEANLTAGRLLGVDQQQLLERYLVQFVTTDLAKEFARLLARALGGLSKQEGLLTMRRAGGGVFFARLVITIAPADDASPTQCLVALDDVTSKHHEERHSLAQLRGITEFAMDGIISVDGQFRIILFNRAAETMFGRRADEMMGGPINSLIRTGLSQMQPKRQGSGTAAGDAAPMVNGFSRVTGQRPDGVEFPLEASVSEVEVEGSIIRTAILRDISRLLKTETECRRLAAIVENSFDAILTRDRENIITTWNSGAEDIFGYTAAEIVGKPYAMLVPPLNQAHTRPSAAEDARNLLPEQIDTTRVTKNGEILTVSVMQSPLRNAEREVQEISEMLRDVTRARVAEKIIRESEAAFTGFFNNAPVGLVWVRPEGVVARTNQTFLAMIGRTKTSVVGQPVASWFFDPKSVGNLEDELRRHHTVKNFRSELKSADGLRVHVLIDAIRADPRKGRIYTHWFIRDITAQIELEDFFLRAIDEERILLCTELHDELGQQLVGIQYLCEAEATVTITKAKKHPLRAKKIVLLLQQAVTQFRSLIVGLSPLGVEGLDLEQFLRVLAESVRSRHKCECNIRYDRRFYLDDHASLIHVYQLIQEAINNAVRYGLAGWIDVALLRESGSVKVTVEHDGRGVNTARADGSSGIGLKMITYRARACGGSVSLKPREGGGAILTCLIPLQGNLRAKPKL